MLPLPNPQSPEFPNALKAAREAKGMSRAQLARAANIHPVMPRRYEEVECNEFTRPTANTLLALNRALGLFTNHLEKKLALNEATIEEIIEELHIRNIIPTLSFPQPVSDITTTHTSAEHQPKLEPRSALTNEQLEETVAKINKIGRMYFKGIPVTADDLYKHPEIINLNLSRDEFEDVMNSITGPGGRSFAIPGSEPLCFKGSIIFSPNIGTTKENT